MFRLDVEFSRRETLKLNSNVEFSRRETKLAEKTRRLI